MVVQWSPQRQQGYDPHKGRSSDTWARLPYTKRPIYLRGNTISSMFLIFDLFGWEWVCKLSKHDFNASFAGDFLGSEDSGFQLYPVFADGEGEPMYAKGRLSISGCFIQNSRMTGFQHFHGLIKYSSDVFFFNSCSHQRRLCCLHDAHDHLLPLHRPVSHPHPLPEPVRASFSVAVLDQLFNERGTIKAG